MKLRFGISPCPNDTFAFHGLLTGASDRHGLDRDPGLEIVLCDVQELNERLALGELDAGKASFAQALRLTRDYGVLPVGAAVGFGVGPLLIAKTPLAPPDAKSRVLCPGEGTTATLLLRLFHPRVKQLVQVNFARIMPAVASGAADYGVVIHEGRFTYQRLGLHCVEDLGATWEARTGAPLPLGGLLARRSLGGDVHRRLAAAIRASLAHARANRDAALATMRKHAQELDDAAIWQHVDLYVNELTEELGARGTQALAAFERAARVAGLVPAAAPPLVVLR
jgi:1,4-dihydroxy-6-naphthoate synthase